MQTGRSSVSFSGGRDSSLILALACHVARREGFEDPVAITMRHPSEGSQETPWEELAISHLGVRDWQRVDAGDTGDLLGPDATTALCASASSSPRTPTCTWRSPGQPRPARCSRGRAAMSCWGAGRGGSLGCSGDTSVVCGGTTRPGSASRWRRAGFAARRGTSAPLPGAVVAATSCLATGSDAPRRPRGAHPAQVGRGRSRLHTHARGRLQPAGADRGGLPVWHRHREPTHVQQVLAAFARQVGPGARPIGQRPCTSSAATCCPGRSSSARPKRCSTASLGTGLPPLRRLVGPRLAATGRGRMVDVEVLQDLWRSPVPHAGTMMLARSPGLISRGAQLARKDASLRGSAQSPGDAMSRTVSSGPAICAVARAATSATPPA